VHRLTKFHQNRSICCRDIAIFRFLKMAAGRPPSWISKSQIFMAFSKIQNGSAFLVRAYPGCPGKEAVKRERAKL